MIGNNNYDPYCYEDTNVLINNLNIKDNDELEKYERKIVSEKLLDLHMIKPIGKFDINHYLAIHKFLFKDIYPFAGKIRTVDIIKGNTYFARYLCIRGALKETLDDMSKKLRHVTTIEEYARLLGDYYITLNIAHPFREGNGRCEREFLREYVSYLNQYIQLPDVELDYSRMDKETLLYGTVNMNNDIISGEFINALVPIEKIQHK